MWHLKINPLEKFIFVFISMFFIHLMENSYLKLSYGLFFLFLILRSGLSTKKVLGIFGSVIFFLIPSFFIQGRALNSSFLFTMISSISCIYFFLLTTEIKEFYHLGRYFKLPNLFCELAILTFGYLNLMFKSYQEVKIAMTARGGFNSFKTVHRDIALLFGAIFKKLYFSLNERANAMHSRCYTDDMKFYPVCYKITLQGIIFLSFWIVMNLTLKVSTI